MKTISFSAILDGVNLKKDGTLSLKIGTQELQPEETAEIFKLGNKQIYTAFSETHITKEDLQIPDDLPDLKGEKSPSKRFKDRLWVYYKETKGTTDNFNSWYNDTLEKLGQHYLDKLN